MVVERFAQHERAMQTAIARGLAEGANEAAKAARAVPTRYRIQAILGSIQPTSVTRTARGYAVAIQAGDFREVFFEAGTYKSRRRKLKQPGRRRSTSDQRGVKAGYFIRKGHAAGWPKALAAIAREMSRV